MDVKPHKLEDVERLKGLIRQERNAKQRDRYRAVLWPWSKTQLRKLLRNWIAVEVSFKSGFTGIAMVTCLICRRDLVQDNPPNYDVKTKSYLKDGLRGEPNRAMEYAPCGAKISNAFWRKNSMPITAWMGPTTCCIDWDTHALNLVPAIVRIMLRLWLSGRKRPPFCPKSPRGASHKAC